MLLTSVNNGTPEGIRTPDLWYRNSKTWSLRECVTGVERAVNVWRRQWILGAVAVSVAVRTERFISGWVAAAAAPNHELLISSEFALGRTGLLGNGLGTTVTSTVAEEQ